MLCLSPSNDSGSSSCIKVVGSSQSSRQYVYVYVYICMYVCIYKMPCHKEQIAKLLLFTYWTGARSLAVLDQQSDLDKYIVNG